jgi:hypothetical protein
MEREEKMQHRMLEREAKMEAKFVAEKAELCQEMQRHNYGEDARGNEASGGDLGAAARSPADEN